MTGDEQIKEIFEAVKSVHKLAIDLQAAFSATQIGLIAITEQLTGDGLIHGGTAADRMRELKDQTSLSTEAARAVDILAGEIEQLGTPTNPVPPRGGKPTLVR